MIDSPENGLVSFDTCDESRSRFSDVLERTIDSKKAGPLQQHKEGGNVINSNDIDNTMGISSDSNKETTTWTCRPPLWMISGSTQPALNPECKFDTNDDSRNRRQARPTDPMHEKKEKPLGAVKSDAQPSQASREVVNDSSNKSRCRNNSSYVSTDQKAQQLVTCVSQNRCIEPTVVNSCSIDECLATNKFEFHKQDPTPMSNKWLSNTLLRFTSSVLGKSNAKNKTGEESIGNINPNSHLNVNIKLEFNFFL